VRSHRRLAVWLSAPSQISNDSRCDLRQASSPASFSPAPASTSPLLFAEPFHKVGDPISEEDFQKLKLAGSSGFHGADKSISGLEDLGGQQIIY
jgi:hypothetical protein